MTDNTAELAVGLMHTQRMVVEPRHSVPEFAPDWPEFQAMPTVMATAVMIALMERACIAALEPFLTDTQWSVGTVVKINHVAATPIGMDVVTTVELIAVDGRSLRFKVTCHDDEGLIGQGELGRAIVEKELFNRRLKKITERSKIFRGI